jgi:Nif-specific regulatory protein
VEVGTLTWLEPDRIRDTLRPTALVIYVGRVRDEPSRFSLLYDLGCTFAARLELDELVPLVIQKCREVLDAEGAAVILLDDTTHELFFPYVAEEDREVADRLVRLRFPAHLGIAGAVLQSAEPVRVDDVSSDPRFYPEIDRLSGLTTRCLVSAPLIINTGVIGVVSAVNRRAREAFDDDDLGLLAVLSGSVAVAIDNARRWRELRSSADRLRTQVGALQRDLARRDRFDDMVGTGPAMAEVFRLMEIAAASPISVLIEGETGTGKEMVARGIHRASARASEHFLALNCSAIPEALLESELFGHSRGAFTGATRDQKGLFEAASGGTLFLDEIGEMPASMQVKLLRALQEGEVTPVGEHQPRRVDVRIISATNRDLREEIACRRFREDLYYRIAAFPIRMPPLRERRDDIPVLTDRFLAEMAARHKKRIAGISPPCVDRLAGFAWPGNLRQLKNEIERAVALTEDGAVVGAAQLSATVLEATEGTQPVRPPAPSNFDLRAARTAFEVDFIGKVLDEHGRNVSRAALALGISRVALQKKMREYGLRVR